MFVVIPTFFIALRIMRDLFLGIRVCSISSPVRRKCRSTCHKKPRSDIRPYFDLFYVQRNLYDKSCRNRIRTKRVRVCASL
jgi:hypothetical protein